MSLRAKPAPASSEPTRSKRVSNSRSPIKDSVVVCAHGVRVDDLLFERMFARGLFIHFDAQPRRVARQPVTVLCLEGMPDHFPTPGHVGEHVFLDQEIWSAQREVQGGGIGDRA